MTAAVESGVTLTYLTCCKDINFTALSDQEILTDLGLRVSVLEPHTVGLPSRRCLLPCSSVQTPSKTRALEAFPNLELTLALCTRSPQP